MAKLFSRRDKPIARAENLDDLLKLNRGRSTVQAEETGERPGFILPFGKTAKTELTYNRGYQPQQVMAAEYPQEESPFYEPYQWPTEETSPTESSGQIESFLQSVSPSIQAVASTPDGGATLADGTTVYKTGRIINPKGQEIYGIASLPGNLTLYTDGSVRGGGLEDLIKGIFGQERVITQAYGNYNPSLEPGSGYNLGTDIMTKDLTQRGQSLGDDAQILQIFQDDGTRWGEKSGHQGYGNSILVKLPTGEMLRFSHLANLPEGINLGAVIPAGTQFIFPGATGNVTGEHLDLEYYNANGQIDKPTNFGGWSKMTTGTGQQVDMNNLPQEIKQYVNSYLSQVQNQPQASMMPPQEQTQQAQQPQQPQQPSVFQQAIQRIQPDLGVSELASGQPQQAGQALSGTIERALPQTGIDLGVTEALRGDPEGARQVQTETIGNLGKKVGIGMGTADLAREQKTNPFRQLAGNLVDVATTPLKRFGMPDTGFSEALAGGKTVNTDLNLAPQSVAYDSSGKQINKPPSAQDYANVLNKDVQRVAGAVGETLVENISPQTKFISGLAETAPGLLGAAGAGLEKLKGAYQGVRGLFNRPNMSDLGSEKVIGQEQSSSLDTASPTAGASAQLKQDTRDPFFKGKGPEQLSSFIDPTATDYRTLTTQTFKPDFYQDPSRIASVFKGTGLEEPATQQFRDYFSKQYANPEFDQSDVSRITQGINLNLPDYGIQTPQRAPQEPPPSLEDYLSKGKTVEQWYAETGQQGTLDQMRQQGVDPRANAQQQSYNPQSASASGSSGFAGGTSGGGYGGGGGGSWGPAKPAPGTYITNAGGQTQQVSNTGVPTSQPSAQLTYQATQSPSLFERAKLSIAKLFRR